MSLTTDDLQAIKAIIDDAFEDSDRRTAAGFAEVHEKIDQVKTELKADITRIENKLTPTITQVEDHEVRLAALEPHAA